MENQLGIDDYEIKAWIKTLGSMPVERVAHEDLSESYEMTEAHVFKLENGQYALVTEDGCSCYSADEAEIELFPTQEKAVDKFNIWLKKNKRSL
jgi:hypothetical protein